MSYILVIARFDEDVSWVERLNKPYLIYNKGEGNIACQQKLKTTIRLDGYYHFKYIVDNYDELPDFVGFCQAFPFDHCINFIDRVNSFSGNCDLYYLSDRIFKEKHENNSDLKKCLGFFYDFVKVTDFVFANGQQFFISKQKILQHPKRSYQQMLKFIEDNPNNENIPHLTERLWLYIFFPELNKESSTTFRPVLTSQNPKYD